MSEAKAHKPAHGEYPGVMAKLRSQLGLNRPENLAPAPYKVGDRVRIVTGPEGLHGFKPGTVATLKEQRDRGWSVLGYDGRSSSPFIQWLDLDDFEPE